MTNFVWYNHTSVLSKSFLKCQVGGCLGISSINLRSQGNAILQYSFYKKIDCPHGNRTIAYRFLLLLIQIYSLCLLHLVLRFFPHFQEQSYLLLFSVQMSDRSVSWINSTIERLFTREQKRTIAYRSTFHIPSLPFHFLQ